MERVQAPSLPLTITLNASYSTSPSRARRIRRSERPHSHQSVARTKIIVVTLMYKMSLFTSVTHTAAVMASSDAVFGLYYHYILHASHSWPNRVPSRNVLYPRVGSTVINTRLLQVLALVLA